MHCAYKTCNNIPEDGFKQCVRCIRRAHLKRLERLSNGLCNNCNRPAISSKKRCQVCLDNRNKYQRDNKTGLKSNNRYRDIVYDYYGRICKCCGETNPQFLTIDHINGRKNTPEGSNKSYYLIARFIMWGNPRTDIQILCYNCNCGKHRNKGICPHKVGNCG